MEEIIFDLLKALKALRDKEWEWLEERAVECPFFLTLSTIGKPGGKIKE